MIIDGIKTREALTTELITKIKKLSYVPKLAIIQVGDRPDSTAFIRAKKIFAKKIGINEIHVQMTEETDQDKVIEIIKQYNKDDSVHGIIVQLPLPSHINKDDVIDAIDFKKDTDGLTSVNVKRWLEGKKGAIMPATARGIKELLAFNKISLKGKNVTVVGRSMLVGKPISSMCLSEDATVTICHSKTENLASKTKEADILIVAVGKPGFIKKEYVSKNQIVIDVGISRMEDGSLAGDVNFEDVKDVVAMISPVPGGVGPMTVFALFENLVQS